MINPFTIGSRITALQQEVLAPLYTMHGNQEESEHDWLMEETGRIVEKNIPFLEEAAKSSLVSTIFTLVKLFGGAEGLSHDDFNRFTGYVNNGGLRAMVRMLLSEDKEATFLSELKCLPADIQSNAHLMLDKSAVLHDEFIEGYFHQQYGSFEAAPSKLRANRRKSTEFIRRLAQLAENE